MRVISYIVVITFFIAFASCRQASKDGASMEENEEAKAMLQGIWQEDGTDEPLMNIVSDTIFYTDEAIAPVRFKIYADSLITYGAVTNGYRIEKLTQHLFWFHSIFDEHIRLHKADEHADVNAFIHKTDVPVYEEVVKKDSVVYYNNHRYHGYVYINPSRMRITKPGLSDEGIAVDNVYYDNIIHICVYEGKTSLFAQDIRKQMFEDLIPPDFYQYAVLSDMDFGGVDAKGYRFQASFCIPDEASCYLVNLMIDKEGHIDYVLVR